MLSVFSQLYALKLSFTTYNTVVVLQVQNVQYILYA